MIIRRVGTGRSKNRLKKTPSEQTNRDGFCTPKRPTNAELIEESQGREAYAGADGVPVWFGQDIVEAHNGMICHAR